MILTVHNVCFEQYHAPVSKMPLDITYIYVYDTGHIKGKIIDLEFENYNNVKKCISRTFKQAGTNICSMGYENSNFKI